MKTKTYVARTWFEKLLLGALVFFGLWALVVIPIAIYQILIWKTC